VKQVIRHRAVRIVANRTILGHGRMLICKRALLLRVALVAHHIDSGLFQIVFGLAMRIVAIGAHDLAFLDWMVRRHRVLSVNVGMALVTNVRVINRHWHSVLAIDMRMLNSNNRLHV
jgi:hypothetical protein